MSVKYVSPNNLATLWQAIKDGFAVKSHSHSDATAAASGFMSTADKNKLDGVAASANNYSHPTGDGNSHVPVTGTENNGKVLMAGATANSAAWGTLPAATALAAGLMSATDKQTLDGLSAGGVSGVKGDAETVYRTGNVNLTPANIGAMPGWVQRWENANTTLIFEGQKITLDLSGCSAIKVIFITRMNEGKCVLSPVEIDIAAGAGQVVGARKNNADVLILRSMAVDATGVTFENAYRTLISSPSVGVNNYDCIPYKIYSM